MPQSNPRKRKESGELKPSLNVLERIDSLLKEHLLLFPWKLELTEEEIEHWHKDLSPFPIAAIEWAFENWRRNGRFFPVYGDILDQCIAWKPKEDYTYVPGCSAECLAKHGTGYNEIDIRKLMKLYIAKYPDNRWPKPLVRLTDAQWDELYDELDKVPGGPPEWRKPA
jgi:hypothetical protein